MKIYSYTTLLNESGNPYLKKANAYDVDGRKKYNSPDHIAKFVYNGLELHNYAEEYAYVLCFDTAYHLIGCFEISHGTADTTFMNPREVFQKALMIGATYIAVTHNHPSGDPTPSKADIETTEKIKAAAKIIGIPLLDHIIVGKDKYYTLREESEVRR